MPDRRRTFGPVVGVGVLAAGVVAYAGSRPWVEAEPGRSDSAAAVAVAGQGSLGAGEMPLALAVGLAVLACWGVVLVTRGRVRRGAALLASAGSVALAVVVVVGALTLRDQVTEAVRADTLVPSTDVATSWTVWLWVAAVAALLSLGATVLATAWCPAWPEMGSRYDAPGAAGGRPDGDPPAGEASNLDLWKQLDEGRDPTA